MFSLESTFHENYVKQTKKNFNIYNIIAYAKRICRYISIYSCLGDIMKVDNILPCFVENLPLSPPARARYADLSPPDLAPLFRARYADRSSPDLAPCLGRGLFDRLLLEGGGEAGQWPSTAHDQPSHPKLHTVGHMHIIWTRFWVVALTSPWLGWRWAVGLGCESIFVFFKSILNIYS